MQELLFTSGLLALAVGAAFFLVVRKLASPSAVAPPTAEWLEQFSVARYRPMERLLDDADFAFVASHRGSGPALVRRLRAQRRKFFRGYLNLLRRDFQRIVLALELQLVHSPEDRPELAGVLLKQRAAFTLGLLQVETRLLLHACGWGRVDVRGLLTALDSLRLEVRPMAIAGAAA